jgi:peptide/nickel transport system substrate-binding protein
MSKSSRKSRWVRDPRQRPAGRALVALVGALALTLTACGGNSDSDSDGQSSNVKGQAPDVAKNQTLVVGVATLQQQYADPVLANEGGNTYPIKWSVGEPLIRQDNDLNRVGALATDWKVSDDGLTWTVNLRDGVKMQDGTPFTAADVETSIKRVKSDPTLFTSYAAYATKIDKVTVVDDHTIEIVTNVPYANAVFDTPPPIATDYFNKVGEKAFEKAPIAAGPWKFDSAKFNDSMTLTRFDDFWDKDRLANFTTLVLKIIPDESSRVSGLQTGQIDVAQGLTPNSADQLKGSADIKLVSSKDASIANVFFMDNYFPEDSPLKDQKVRQALMMAIDRDSIASSLYRGFGSVPANATLPTTLGNDGSLKPWPYDPDKAKQMLADAGASDLKFTLHLYNATTAIADVVKFAEAVAGYWKEIGVDVKVDAMDPATYLDQVVKHQLTGAVILGTPGLLISDPQKLSIFYTSTGGYSTVKDPKLDAMFDQLSATVDEGQQTDIAGDISRYLHETLYGLPVVSLDAVYGVGPKVATFEMMDGNPYAGPFYYLRAN